MLKTNAKNIIPILFAILLITSIAASSTLTQAASTDIMGNTVTGSTNYSGTSQATGTGTTSYTPVVNSVRANSIVASKDGTIVSLGINIRTASSSATVMMAIYADASGNPGAILAQTDATVTSATGWLEMALDTPVDVTSGTTYWIAFAASTATTLRFNSATGTNTLYYVTQTYGSFPDPFGTASTTSNIVTQRMTYSGSPSGNAYATQVTLDGSIARLQSLSFYSSTKGFYRLALYTNNAETSSPGSLLWQSYSDGVSVGWNTLPIAAGQPSTLQNLDPGVYWLAFQWGSSSAGPNMISGDAGTGYSMAMSYDVFPSTWDSGSSTSTQWSIYATYNILVTITPVPTPRATITDSDDNAASEATAVPTAVPTATPAPTAAPILTGTVTATRSSDNAVFDVSVSGNVAASQVSGLTITPNEAAQTTEVGFTITGDSDSSASLTMTIPKAAIAYGTEPVVYIDGVAAQDQSYTEDGQNYYVTYTAHFSTHNVKIVFAAASDGASNIDSTTIIVIAIVVVLVIVAVSVFMLRSKRGHAKTS
jgi:hypothetical protein